MNWEISWADMCRACMEVEGVLFPLYDEDSEIGESYLPDKLAELASIEINKSDGLPTNLCEKCANKINTFLEFKYLVQETDKKLRHMFNAQVVCDIKDDHVNESMCEKIESVYNKNEYDIKKDCNFVEKQENNFSNEYHNNDDTVLESMERQIGESAIVENFDNTCDPVILKVTCTDDEVQGLHIMLHTDEFNAIHNTKECKIIKSESEIQRQVKFSSSLENLENMKEEVDYSLQVSEVLEKAVKSKILENSNLPINKVEQDDSDSDCYGNIQENIIGSLNDTVTKVKEIREAGKDTQFQCTLCLQNYAELSEALSHIVDLHVPISGPFYCVVCEKDCESIKELKSHVKTHKGPSPYTCFLCNKSYVMKRYLKRHMACHTDFPRHRCTKCGERFKVKSELEAHVSSHAQGAPFKCSQCPRVFNHKGNYKRHLISHLDPQGQYLPKYPCIVCNRRFLNNRTLVTHMRVHTGEKPYHCDICSKSFSQHGNLLNHLKIHTNPRSFTCEVCGKSFNQKATLKDHSLLHSGEKPYVCTVCGSAFTFSAALRRHMWTHSERKPFECDVCNAKFIGRYDLKRHMKIHSGKPKLRRSKSNKTKDSEIVEVPEETINVVQNPSNPDTIFVEQIFLCDDSIQIISQDSEKENIDSLFGLIQYT